MKIRRVITAFFTFLGYLTFLSLILAAIVLYIGYRKAEKRANATTDTSFKEVPMTPAKTPSADTTAALPYFEPISKAPKMSARQPAKWTPKAKTKKTKTKTAKPKPVRAVSVAPVLYTSLDDEPESAAKKTAKWAPKAKTARAKTAKPAKAKLAAIVQANLPGTSIVQFKATDSNHSNTRAGRGYVPDVTKTTALEAEVKRRKDLEEIKRAAETIRNPPVWGSNKK